jgi:hypothetical protein
MMERSALAYYAWQSSGQCLLCGYKQVLVINDLTVHFADGEKKEDLSKKLLPDRRSGTRLY